MEAVSIGLSEPPGPMREALDAALQPLLARGARVEMRESRRGTLYFLGCAVEGDVLAGDAARATSAEFRQAVAAVLCSWIVDRQQPALLRRLIGAHYGYLGTDERECILDLVQREVGSAPAARATRVRQPQAVRRGGTPAAAAAGPSGRTDPRGAAREEAERGGDAPPRAAGQPAVPRAPGAAEPRAHPPGLAARRALVLQRLGEYLDRQRTLVVDGFVTFRLKDYVDELVAAIDRAVDAFLLEREHREFVDLLRHVVRSRPDRPPEVHCVFDAAGGFALRDDTGRDLARTFLDDLRPDAAAGEVGADDLLVSALITVAPQRVRLHLPDGAGPALSQDALATLEAVFSGAVRVCRGCARCERARGAGP